MKFKGLLFLLVMLLFASIEAMAATTTVIMDMNSADVVKTGAWTRCSQGGYKSETVYESNGGSVMWTDKTMFGTARVSYWVTVDEDGSSDSTIRLKTEHADKTYPISFAEGNSGWREIGFIPVTGLGARVTIQGGKDAKAFVSAVKIEYLDLEYRSIYNFALNSPEHIIIGDLAPIAYQNSKRVNMEAIPEFEGEDIFVGEKAISEFFGAKIDINENMVSVTVDGKTFSGISGAEEFNVDGKTVSGCIAKSFGGKTLINIAKIAKNMNKQIFVSKLGVVVITDSPIELDDRINRNDILNMLSVLRNEVM